MPSQTKRRRGVSLPWEGRSVWLAELISGKSWRVVLLSALLLAVVSLIWSKAMERTRVRITRAAIAEVRRAVLAFHEEVGRCPHSSVELVHPPKAGARYLNALPNDGWNRPLYIRCQGGKSLNSVIVISAGPSGSFNNDDNVF